VTFRRATGAVSAVLLVLLSVALAEAALLVLVLVFSSILQLQLNFQIGDSLLQTLAQPASRAYIRTPILIVQQAGIVVSILFTFACAAASAAWRFRRWRPA
jgi:hypothetical protein